MPRAKRLPALIALLAATVVVLVLRVVLARPALDPAIKAPWSWLPYQSEDQWIVTQTARAVIDLARFAKSPSPTPTAQLALSGMAVDPANPRRLAFRVGARDVAIDVRTYVWDPDAYVMLARSEGAEGRAGSTTPASDDVAAALLGFTVERFQVQNDAISIALQKDYHNPSNHENAALLLSAVALREASRFFYDPRLALCRVAAHLAVARALRGGAEAASPAGRLADIIVQVVAGRAGPAMKQLEAFERTNASPVAQAWARALRRRATHDWREPTPDSAALVERLEYMRAMARMLEASASLEYLRTHHVEPAPDWGWRALDLPLTVENGHAFVDDTFERTLSEAAQVLGVRDPDAANEITAALSREPAVSSIDRTAAGGIRVVDDGLWSAFYQRELAHVASRGSSFYRDLYGSREDAEIFERDVDSRLGGTPLWPIVRRLRARAEPSTAGKARQDALAANYRETMARAAPMLVDRPQLVPYLAWLSVGETPRGVAPIDIPQASLWFRTIFPTGTVFETRRMNVQRIIPDDFVAHADAIHELAPWDPEITINWSLVRCHKGCTPEQERANYANIAAYSVTTMRKFAYTDPDPVASLRRVCDVSAPDCATLADWLRSRERFPEAAAAYEEFFRRGLDRVSVSNTVEWTVRYYQRAGRLRDAKRLAEMAAEVGSAGGIRALAGVYDREGQHQQAAALYRQILGRYDDGEDLLAYFIRRADATGTAPDDPEYPVLLERYFGGDFDRVATSSLSGAPTRGLFVNSTTWWNEKAGVRRGDIIVALDGVRVWTPAQSNVLYERSFDAPLRYTVWRKDRYLDIEAPFRRFYYGVDMSEYPPRRPDAENHS